VSALLAASISRVPAPPAAVTTSVGASAAAYEPSTQTHAPTPAAPEPYREELRPSGTALPSARAVHARRSRRRPAVIIAAVAAAATLALTVPVLLARGTPPATQLSAGGPFQVHDLTLPTQVGAQFGGIMFSPDGRLLAAGSGGHAYLWDLATGQRSATLNDPGGGARNEAFSPDIRQALAAVRSAWARRPASPCHSCIPWPYPVVVNSSFPGSPLPWPLPY
jgi:hypothetical protein